MNYTRIYTGEDGLTHFQDVDVPLTSGEHSQYFSELIKATGIIFRITGADYDFDYHNAPRKQFIVNLDGGVEITASDGTVRVFGSGEIILAEDTTGKGHISRAVNNQPRKSLFIPLE